MKVMKKAVAASLPLLFVGACNAAPKNVDPNEALPVCDDNGRLVLYTGQFAVDMAKKDAVSLDRVGGVLGRADDTYTNAYYEGKAVSALFTLHRPQGDDPYRADNQAIASGEAVGAEEMRRVLAAGYDVRVPLAGIDVVGEVSQGPVNPAATVQYGQMVVKVYEPCKM